MKYRIFSAELLTECLNRYNSGEALKDIGKELHIDRGSIGFNLEKSGVILRHKSVNVMVALKGQLFPLEDAMRMYQVDDMSFSAIAKELGYSNASISNHLSPYLVFDRTKCVDGKKKAMRGAEGNRIKHQDGYVSLYLPNHPSAEKGGMIKEHRVVMEKKIGRQLIKGEVVHHRNGIRNDNRPENLALISPLENIAMRYLCADCELKKEIRLLRLQIKTLSESLNYKLQEGH